MKTLDEIIARRRSVRKYDAEKKVDQNTIEQIITATQEAPSWNNTLTGRYHVVTSADLKEELMPALHPQNQKAIADAPVLVVTTFERDKSGFTPSGEQVNELGNEWGAYDLGVQAAYFILKATDLGLDTVVLGLRDADKIREVMNIPESQIIVSVLGLGYRAAEPNRPRRKELTDVLKMY